MEKFHVHLYIYNFQYSLIFLLSILIISECKVRYLCDEKDHITIKLSIRIFCIYGRVFLRFRFYNITYNASSLIKIPKLTFRKSKINDEIRKEVQKGRVKNMFNDPDLNQQWYFLRYDPLMTYLSHELDKVWELGITGKGITVGILDGGIEIHHRDLIDNHAKNISFNFIENSHHINSSNNVDPTKYAGLISSSGNNYQCGVGAAPSSFFASLQIFNNENNYFNEFTIIKALTHYTEEIQIYLINWEFNYFMNLRSFPTLNILLVLIEAYMTGRSGLGTIFLTSAGNKAEYDNNCAFNGFNQLRQILVIGAITESYGSTAHSEKCTAILVSALIVANNIGNYKFYSTVTGNNCENSTAGLYTATSITAGILSLLLSYNPLLTVRQIIFLTIITSIQYDVNSVMNGVGFYYSYSFGFGFINAYQLILSSKIEMVTNMMPEKVCTTSEFIFNKKVEKYSSRIFYLYTSGCLESGECVTEIEETYIIFTLTLWSRNSVSVYLTSPFGTKFKIIKPRSFDTSRNGFHDWRLKILGYFGENPIGVWTLEIETVSSVCKFIKFKLMFHGTCQNKVQNIFSHRKVKDYISEVTIDQNSTNPVPIYYNSTRDMKNKYKIDDFAFTGGNYYFKEQLATLYSS